MRALLCSNCAAGVHEAEVRFEPESSPRLTTGSAIRSSYPVSDPVTPEGRRQARVGSQARPRAEDPSEELFNPCQTGVDRV